MKILWLPHHNWEFIRQGQREFRFVQQIKDVHDIHVLTWSDVRARPTAALNSLRTRTWSEDGLTIHRARRVPNFLGRRIHASTARGLRVNELLHQRAIRTVIRREGIDLVICGLGHQSIGLPPHDLDIPVVFDYLDFKLEAWPDVEAEYLEVADAVVCTSQVLVERTHQRHPHTYYLPNGVDLDAAAAADGARVRRQYGLGDATVVSLIGVTASTHLFYIEGIAAAARVVPNLLFLLVGDGGEFGEAMTLRARQLGLRTVVTGPVPPSEVADFFAATDVGLYPGDQNPYFDAAAPLKVLEYSAAGKPVVATDLAELRNWGFPNVRLAAPTADAFAQEIELAVNHPHQFPELNDFSWPTLAARLLAILDEVARLGNRSTTATPL